MRALSSRLTALALLLSVLVLAAVATATAEVGAPATPISAKPDGTLGGGDSNFGSVSANGRYVVFASNNPSLTSSTDTNTTYDVFRRDLQTGTTELVTKKLGSDLAANGQSGLSMDISADGRYVMFSSLASDMGPDTDVQEDIFVRDMQTGTTALVDEKAGGGGSGNGDNNGAHMTPDGRYVAWVSTSTDISPLDSNALSDVYRRDLTSGTTDVVSVNSGGTAGGNQPSSAPLITPDGRHVAFFSTATDLTATPDGNSNPDIFRRDVTAGTTQLLTINAAGTGTANAFSTGPFDITPDGRYVSFISQATDLTADGNGNGTGIDSFRRDVTGGHTDLVSVNRAGTASGNSVSADVFLSDDGRYAVFESDATDLVDPGVDANGFRDVYFRDITGGTTKLVSVADGGGASADGRSRAARISPDGRYVSFESQARNLVGGGIDHNDTFVDDIYRRDMQFDSTRLISINFDRTAATGGFAHVLLPNGDVAYTSASTDVVPPGGDTGTGNDLFISRNTAPTGASFTVTPEAAQALTPVAFEGSATDLEGPVTYSWEFGDGGTATGASASHTYTMVGPYTVKLTVTDRDGAASSASRAITVMAPAVPPSVAAPVVSGFSVRPSVFRVGPGPTATSARARKKRSPKGTKFTYTLSEAATARLTIEQRLSGRRKGGRCVKPTRKLRKKPKCTRFVRRGVLSRRAALGKNTLKFSGRIGSKALKPGRYRATIVATDSAARRSKARRVSFRVVKR